MKLPDIYNIITAKRTPMTAIKLMHEKAQVFNYFCVIIVQLSIPAGRGKLSKILQGIFAYLLPQLFPGNLQ